MSDDFKEIIGSKVLNLYYSKGKNVDYIRFRITNSEGARQYLVYWLEADCCSETFLYHISGLENLIGYTVLSIEEKTVTNIQPSIRQDIDDAYFYTFKTDKGHCDLEIRNSSNGYYGGSISLVDIDDDIRPIIDNFEEITEDF